MTDLIVQHTLGPWKVDNGLRSVEAKAFNGLYKNICSPVRGGSPDEADANARLIAAAPELLDALRWFIDDIDGIHTIMYEFDEAVARARAAIAKAVGGI